MAVIFTGTYKNFDSFTVRPTAPIPDPVENLILSQPSTSSLKIGYAPIGEATRTQYSLDGGPWMEMPANGTLTGLSLGPHTVQVRGLNNLGAAGPVASATITLNTVYNYAQTTVQTLAKPGTVVDGAAFGWIVSASGDGSMTAIGAPAPNPANQIGNVYIYQRSASGDLTLRQTIERPDSTVVQWGNALAMSRDGSTLAISAVTNNATASLSMFRKSGTTYTNYQNIVGVNQQFASGGITFSPDGNYLLAGSLYNFVSLLKKAPNGSYSIVKEKIWPQAQYNTDYLNGYGFTNKQAFWNNGFVTLTAIGTNARFYDLEGAHLYSFPGSDVSGGYSGVALTDDGLTMAFAPYGGYGVEVWTRANTSTSSWSKIYNHTYYPRGNSSGSNNKGNIYFSADGTMIAMSDESYYGALFYSNSSGSWGLGASYLPPTRTGSIGFSSSFAKDKSMMLLGSYNEDRSGKVYVVRPSV